MPDALAVVVPRGYGRDGKRAYARHTFRELDRDSDRIARGLCEMGVAPDTRLALLVRPGFEFISIVFGLFKAGAVGILIDPGMGRRNLIRCLSAARPEGFIAISQGQAVRAALKRRFAAARFNVTVGRRWFWGGPTLDELRGGPWTAFEPVATSALDPAAIIFTTGSTGPPKGVVYRHGNFDAQVDEIRSMYGIEPGEIDLPGFPLFGLFNAAMGVTTVVPVMDPSRPARVDPRRIVEAIEDCGVTQAFGSPAIWDRVGGHCVERMVRLPSIKRILSAGAPVPARVLSSMSDALDPPAEIHTPYGATEALPVATIGSNEVMTETRFATDQGAGVCVGRKFPGIEWKVIRIVHGPIPAIAAAKDLDLGEIGELIVRGAVVTSEYFENPRANELGKIKDGDAIWHRMGDVGYLDTDGRFWFCGRLAHRVLTANGPLYTIPCEAIFNVHPAIRRSALVGVGPPGEQRPVIVVEPWKKDYPRGRTARMRLIDELRQLAKANPKTAMIDDFLTLRAFPVDIRHNAKIFREKLAAWAARQSLSPLPSPLSPPQ